MEKLINAFQTHWNQFIVHEVIDGYLLEVSNFAGDHLESDVAPTLEALLTAMVPLMCYGRNVSMYQKNSGLISICLVKPFGVVLDERYIAVRLGHPYYHGVSGRYAFQSKPFDSKEIPLMNSQAIAKQLTAMLLAA